MKLGMWVVMGTSTTHVIFHHQMCMFNTSFAYLFWLANNKKVMKLGMWVVMGTSTTHVIFHHQMCMFNTSFAYLFWLANNKKVMKLGMWVVMGTGTTHIVCFHQMYIFNTSFVYLFWLINKKKIKYPEFCMGYSTVMKLDMWVAMGKSTTHMVCCICFDWLITKKSNIISRVLLDTSPKAAHTVYSENIASA